MPINQLIIKQLETIDYQFTQRDFELSYWHTKNNSEALTGGRGASQKITIQRQFYVLRHYLRGGLIARFLRDQYLWTGLKNSRPYQEQQVTQHAFQKLLPVPEVVAFCVQKNGLFYRASIISRFINNSGTLAGWLFDSTLADQQWFELGGVIKRLHQADIFHADLNANNILIDDNGQFSIIDFDKAKIVSPLGTAADNNIQRLLRSLKKIQTSRHKQGLAFNFSLTQWQQLIEGYR